VTLQGLQHNARMLRTVTATRYVTPLREGGFGCRAVIEADDDGLYVLKFRGRRPGAAARLIAELIAGRRSPRVARPCRCPRIVLVETRRGTSARTETRRRDSRDLIRRQRRAEPRQLDYLPGSNHLRSALAWQPECRAFAFAASSGSTPSSATSTATPRNSTPAAVGTAGSG